MNYVLLPTNLYWLLKAIFCWVLFYETHFIDPMDNFLQISKATAVADEAIGNVRTVRAFAMESKEIQ